MGKDNREKIKNIINIRTYQGLHGRVRALCEMADSNAKFPLAISTIYGAGCARKSYCVRAQVCVT